MYCFSLVAFVLRVRGDAGDGEELSFEREARLGRTADNDVVIKDPSSSRSHARIAEKGGRYLVEDLKSANGTKLNGAWVKAARELHTGDLIAIGDVTLEFTLVEPDSDGDPSATTDDEVAGPSEPALPSTHPRSAVRRPPVRRALPRPPPEPEPEPESEPEETAHDDLEAGGGEVEEDGPDATKEVDVPAPRAMARRTGGGAPVRASRSGGDDGAAMSAAERARIRRELEKSTSGRFQLLWQKLGKPARVVLTVLGSLVVLAALGGLVVLAFPKGAPKKIEPNSLIPNSDPIADSFGLGEGVTFVQRDQKAFDFVFASPTRVVGVLHYQAKGISKGEVTIELNGTEVGQVPPDVLDTDSRELDAVLSASLVKVGDKERNQLVFDSTANPPGNEPWKVWNIWVELIPIPEMSAEDASARAKEDMEKASKFWEARDIGAVNLFRAWKTYRDAWLLLEATPNRPESLLQSARARMKEIRPELDRRCSAKLVEYKQVMNAKAPDLVRARSLLEDIPTYFPTREHPCYNISRSLVRDLEGLSEIP